MIVKSKFWSASRNLVLLSVAGCVWGTTFCSVVVLGSDLANEQWKAYMASQAEVQKMVAVQNRLVDPTGRLQLGFTGGTIERRDFTVTTLAGIFLRQHYSQFWGWEILKTTFTSSANSTLLEDVERFSPFPVDTKRSSFQASSSALLTPIYGKYAWFGNSMAHFDVYAKAGLGVRRADVWQPFANLGLGTNHFFGSKHFSVAPEIEVRVYRERRTTDVTVVESLFQLGGSWLF